MTASPNAWPHRAAHAKDVFPPPATARPEQDEPEQDEPEQDEPEQRDAGPLCPDQADPDPPDEGWEPV